MNEDTLAIGGFFFTAIVLGLGIPLVRSWVRRKEREPVLGPGDADRDARLARIEHAVEAMAIEVERISEGQRFVTKLLAGRAEGAAAALPKDTAR
ncbi:MAG: hypothetical protein KJZ74_14755 [Gemmatimonadales bacterium]|nr:hypothetical protein [Gemmatimonadales bacterium]